MNIKDIEHLKVGSMIDYVSEHNINAVSKYEVIEITSFCSLKTRNLETLDVSEVSLSFLNDKSVRYSEISRL